MLAEKRTSTTEVSKVFSDYKNNRLIVEIPNNKMCVASPGLALCSLDSSISVLFYHLVPFHINNPCITTGSND